VLLHCAQLGLSHERAADVRAMPLGTVKTHATRGKAKLKTWLSGLARFIRGARSMSPIHDDDMDNEIDALLRQPFDGPVADAGFSDRVMRNVRPIRRAFPWPLVVCVCAGVFMSWLSLSGSPLLRAAWQGWQAGAWSISTVVTLATMTTSSLLALGFGLAEADDH
jgi:hypothetical protein